MSTLQPNHNHPVVFRKQKKGWGTINKPMAMSERTFKRILLQRALISFPQPLDQPWGGYVTGLAATVGLDPEEADRFLKGALYRRQLLTTRDVSLSS